MSRRRSTGWMRHPATTVQRPLTCPTGLPRYATDTIASNMSVLSVVCAVRGHLRPVQCDRCDGGWHLVPRTGTEEENTP